MGIIKEDNGLISGGALPEVQSITQYSGSGSIATLSSDCKIVLLIYNSGSGDPQTYFTLGGKAPDTYQKSTGAYVLQWNDAASGSALSSSAGSWTVQVAILN